MMAKHASGNAETLTLMMGVLVMFAGLAAGLGWVSFAQKLGDTIVIANIGAAMTIYYALLFAPLIALSFLLCHLEHRKMSLIGMAPRRWLIWGAAMGLAGLLVTCFYAWLNGEIAAGLGSDSGLGLVALGMVLCCVQVAAEELLFRGWLQPALIGRMGVWPGVTLGAVCFAGFHMTSGVLGVFPLINIMLGGLFFGLLALRSGGLVAPFAAHFVWNMVEDQVLGLVPNPGVGVLGALFDYDLVGLPMWGGTEVGLNGSIGTSLVLVALVLPLMRGGMSGKPAEDATPALA